MPAFAVGVVGDDVEHRHVAQPGMVLMHQEHRTAQLVLGLENGDPARVAKTDAHDVDEIVVVAVDPLLTHPDAECPVAQDRRRDDVPARGLGDDPATRSRPARVPSGKSQAAARPAPACRRIGG